MNPADGLPSSRGTFKAEPASISILGLQGNVDVDNLEPFRSMQNEMPMKITQRAVLCNVSAVIDQWETVSPSTIRMQLLVK